MASVQLLLHGFPCPSEQIDKSLARKKHAYKEIPVQDVVVKIQHSFGYNTLIILNLSCPLKSVMLMNTVPLI